MVITLPFYCFLSRYIFWVWIILVCLNSTSCPRYILLGNWLGCVLRPDLQWNKSIFPGRQNLLSSSVQPESLFLVLLAWLLAGCGASIVHPGQLPQEATLTPSSSASGPRPFWLEMFSIVSIFQSFVVNNQFKPAPSLSFCNSKNPLNYIVGRKQ